jgi:hypothetical protein
MNYKGGGLKVKRGQLAGGARGGGKWFAGAGGRTYYQDETRLVGSSSGVEKEWFRVCLI